MVLHLLLHSALCSSFIVCTSLPHSTLHLWPEARQGPSIHFSAGWLTLAWTNGWMDGRTNGRMDERTDGRTDGWMDGRTDGWTDGRTDGWTDGQTDR